MSRMENHFGTITEICTELKGFESKYRHAVDEYGLMSDSDDDEDYIGDPEFHYVKSIDMMFKVESDEEEFRGAATLNIGPSKWAFSATFYNGGADLGEVLDNHFIKMMEFSEER